MFASKSSTRSCAYTPFEDWGRFHSAATTLRRAAASGSGDDEDTYRELLRVEQGSSTAQHPAHTHAPCTTAHHAAKKRPAVELIDDFLSLYANDGAFKSRAEKDSSARLPPPGASAASWAANLASPQQHADNNSLPSAYSTSTADMFASRSSSQSYARLHSSVREQLTITDLQASRLAFPAPPPPNRYSNGTDAARDIQGTTSGGGKAASKRHAEGDEGGAWSELGAPAVGDVSHELASATLVCADLGATYLYLPQCHCHCHCQPP